MGVSGSSCRGEKEEIGTTFWKEWSDTIDEQQKLVNQARNLEQIIPGVETNRFLSGHTHYIESAKVKKRMYYQMDYTWQTIME